MNDRMDYEGCVKARRFLDQVNGMQAELSKACVRLHAAVNVASVKELSLAAQQVWAVQEESRRLFEQMNETRQDYYA